MRPFWRPEVAVALLLAFSGGELGACDSCGCGLSLGAPAAGEVEKDVTVLLGGQWIIRGSSSPRTLDPFQTREVSGPNRDLFQGYGLSLRLPLAGNWTVFGSVNWVSSRVQSAGILLGESRPGDVSAGAGWRWARLWLGPVLTEFSTSLELGIPLSLRPAAIGELRMASFAQAGPLSLRVAPRTRAAFAWEFLALLLDVDASFRTPEADGYENGPAWSWAARLGVKPEPTPAFGVFPYAGVRWQSDTSDRWNGREVPDSGSISADLWIGAEFRFASFLFSFQILPSLSPAASPLENGKFQASLGFTFDRPEAKSRQSGSGTSTTDVDNSHAFFQTTP